MKRGEQAAHVAAELEDVRRRIAGLENRVEAYRGVTARHGEIQAGLQEYQETAGRVESDTRAVQQLMTLRQEEAHWQREVASARAKLQADEQVLQERVQRLRELVTARSVLEQRFAAGRGGDGECCGVRAAVGGSSAGGRGCGPADHGTPASERNHATAR